MLSLKVAAVGASSTLILTGDAMVRFRLKEAAGDISGTGLAAWLRSRLAGP